jgi:site-specific recombinase XerD
LGGPDIGHRRTASTSRDTSTIHHRGRPHDAPNPQHAHCVASRDWPLLQKLRESPELSSQSKAKFLDLLDRFEAFLTAGQGVGSLAEVSRAHVVLFIPAAPAGDTSTEPAAATMHLRRSAIRLLFRLARDSGLDVGDPTLDVRLPPRFRPRVRPLTDAEIEECRRASAHTLAETRLPAAWALAEATARTSELPFILASDVDLASGIVRIHGSSRTQPRLGFPSGWGIQQLKKRLDILVSAGAEDTAVIYKGDRGGASGQASASAAIAWTLRRAGLAADADVRPASVAAWAGRHLFDQGIALEEVARRLGIRSLDRTASFIGLALGGP